MIMVKKASILKRHCPVNGKMIFYLKVVKPISGISNFSLFIFNFFTTYKLKPTTYKLKPTTYKVNYKIL